MLGAEEAEMRIIGMDLHARRQTVAILNVETGEIVEKTLLVFSANDFNR